VLIATTLCADAMRSAWPVPPLGRLRPVDVADAGSADEQMHGAVDDTRGSPMIAISYRASRTGSRALSGRA
jgi:hypothetical protein